MKSKKENAVFMCLKQMTVLVLCLMICVAGIPQAASSKTSEPDRVVRVGWFDSSYNQKDAAGRRSGYSYEYQRKIAAYTGWDYEYVEGSWIELLNKLVDGEIDMLGGVSYTEERAGQMLFPAYSMGTEEYYLYITEERMKEMGS